MSRRRPPGRLITSAPPQAPAAHCDQTRPHNTYNAATCPNRSPVSRPLPGELPGDERDPAAP